MINYLRLKNHKRAYFVINVLRFIFSKNQAISAKKNTDHLKICLFSQVVHIMDKMKFVKYFCQILFCSTIMAIWNSDRSASKMWFFHKSQLQADIFDWNENCKVWFHIEMKSGRKFYQKNKRTNSYYLQSSRNHGPKPQKLNKSA